MTTVVDMKAEWGERFEALSRAYAAGDRVAFMEALSGLSEARERAVQRDLQDLSNGLRRALDELKLNSRLATLAGRDVPDARVRLAHALKLAEEGAHRTLDLVERSCPLADHTAKEAAALVVPLRATRERIGKRHRSVEILARLDEFLAVVKRDSEAVRANLNEVLMAQSSQDLSGQIIRGVINLVTEVERTLTHLSSLAGNGPQPTGLPEASEAADSSHGFGPAVPGVSTGTVGQQNDVDALLADLGM